MAHIKILLAEKQPIVREKLRKLIDSQADMMIVDEACCSEEVLAKASQAEVLLLDSAISQDKILRAIEKVSAVAPETKVVVLSLYEDDMVRYEAMNAGATGFQAKTDPVNELLETIRKASSGMRHGFAPWSDSD